MINATPETKLDGYAQQMKELSRQLSAVYDVSSELRDAHSWYDDPDPVWGGPPSKRQLHAYANRLKIAYMNLALITGLDPCEQFDDTNRKLQQLSDARAVGK